MIYTGNEAGTVGLLTLSADNNRYRAVTRYTAAKAKVLLRNLLLLVCITA